jgi:hypothetical protein
MITLIVDMANGSVSAMLATLALSAFGILCIVLDETDETKDWIGVFAFMGILIGICAIIVGNVNGLTAREIQWYAFCGLCFSPCTYGMYRVFYLAIRLLRRFFNWLLKNGNKE